MAREDAPAPNGPETFDRLKARLGRLPTVDELSRELGTAPRHTRPTDNLARRRYGRPFIVAGVIGLLVMAILFFVGQRSLQQWALSDATPPALPPSPIIETAPALPVPAAVIPPPPADEAPTRRAVTDAPEKARTAPRRQAPAAAPTRAPSAPAAPLVEDAAIQQRVLPDTPASARRTITGRVRINIRVSVDPSGNVIEASSAPPEASRYFTGLAVKAAREWKFAPAPPDRADAAREWVLRFEFGRQTTTAAAVPAVP